MLGIFGGSFDPPHFGHIRSALTLLEYFEFEQIRFIPCQVSPHKQKVHASGQHRLQMLEIITHSYEKLLVDDRELNRQAPSYTIDTLIGLRDELGEHQSLVLLVGMDAYLEFCQWYRYDEILSYAHIMLLQRPGYKLPKTGCEQTYFETHNTDEINILVNSPSGKIYLSDLEKINISSSEIRKTIAMGEQPKYDLPGSVWNYIKRNNLYQ